jgi:hypothetical protein
MGNSNGGGNNNSPLKTIGKLFANIGWEKRLCDLNEDEIVAIAVVFQAIEGLEDVYTQQYLTEVYIRYGGGRFCIETAEDVPF